MHGGNIGKDPGLKKSLGLMALFTVVMGGVSSQSSMVTLLNGAGMGGGLFLLAIILAFLLTLCYVFSYLELSLMMPKAGGPGTYALVALGHLPSIFIVLTAYVFVTPFSGIAELNLLERIVKAYVPEAPDQLGLFVLLAVTLLNIFSVDIFASVQNFIVYVMIISAIIVGFAGLVGSDASAHASNLFPATGSQGGDSSLLDLMVLVLWSFAGLEFVCPMLEESKDPDRHLPRAMIAGAILLLVIYSLFTIGALRSMPRDELIGTETPHRLLVESLFGRSAKWIILPLAVATSTCMMNAVIASTSRILFGMAHHGQLPAFLMKVHPTWKTPWLAIVIVFLSIAIPQAILHDSQEMLILLLLSGTSLWLLGYMTAHLNVIILRRRYGGLHRPFRTPAYPLPQILGIAGMTYVLFRNAPSPDMRYRVYTITAFMVTIALVYGICWVRWHMKRPLFEKATIEQTLRD